MSKFFNDLKLKIKNINVEKISDKTELVGISIPEMKTIKEDKFYYTIDFYFIDEESNKTYKIEINIEEKKTENVKEEKRIIEISGGEAEIEYNKINFITKRHTKYSRIDERTMRLIQNAYENVYGKKSWDTPYSKYFNIYYDNEVKNMEISMENLLEINCGQAANLKDVDMIVKNNDILNGITLTDEELKHGLSFE